MTTKSKTWDETSDVQSLIFSTSLCNQFASSRCTQDFTWPLFFSHIQHSCPLPCLLSGTKSKVAEPFSLSIGLRLIERSQLDIIIVNEDSQLQHWVSKCVWNYNRLKLNNIRRCCDIRKMCHKAILQAEQVLCSPHMSFAQYGEWKNICTSQKWRKLLNFNIQLDPKQISDEFLTFSICSKSQPLYNLSSYRCLLFLRKD